MRLGFITITNHSQFLLSFSLTLEDIYQIHASIISGDPRAPNSHDMRPNSMAIPHRPSNLGIDLTPPRKPHTSLETKTDYGKYRYTHFGYNKKLLIVKKEF